LRQGEHSSVEEAGSELVCKGVKVDGFTGPRREGDNEKRRDMQLRRGKTGEKNVRRVRQRGVTRGLKSEGINKTGKCYNNMEETLQRGHGSATSESLTAGGWLGRKKYDHGFAGVKE